MRDDLRKSLEAGERAAARCALAEPRATSRAVAGLRFGRRPGSSLEFQDYREYQPGDDLRHLDWQAFGRSDRLVLRLYREEVRSHLDLVLDGSRSMAAPAGAKPAAALGLAGFFVRAAIHGGYSHAAWLAAERCRPLGPPGALPAAWEGLGFEHGGSPAEGLSRGLPAFRPDGLRLLVSDLLWPEEPRAVLGALGRGAAALLVVHLVSRAELEPGELGAARLVDVEDGSSEELEIDAAAVARYRRALERHLGAWRLACREAGAQLVTVIAEDLIAEDPLGDRQRGGWRLEAFDELLRSEVLKIS